MRKARILVTLAALVICALFVTLYFWPNPIGKPELKMEFNPSPPWHIRPGENLELNITITNEGKSPAKNVNINFTVATGFMIYQSGTNQYIVTFEELKEKEIKNQILTITISTAITPGNYLLTLIFYAENVPKESYSHQIIVELPT